MLNTDRSAFENPKNEDQNQQPMKTPRPLPLRGRELDRLPAKIRAELNLEKWPQIFAPPHSKKAKRPRTYTRTRRNEDGTTEEMSVSVDYSPHLKATLTTQDRKTLYGLYELRRRFLEEHQDHTGAIRFSVRQLAKALGQKKWGSKNFRDLKKSLMALRGVTTWWVGSFHDSNTGERVSITTGMNILQTLMLAERYKKDQLTFELGGFGFADRIETNLRRNHVTPRFLETAINVRGEIASALYALLDLFLASNPNRHIVISLTKLYGSEYLDLSDTYRYPSKRLEKIKPAVAELDGLPCSTGTLSLAIERTVDGKDYKLIAKSIPFPARLQPPKPNKPKPKLFKLETPEVALAVADVVAQTGDTAHLSIFQCLARLYGPEVLYQALSEWKAETGTRHLDSQQSPIRNLGAYYVHICQRVGKETRSQPRPPPKEPPAATSPDHPPAPSQPTP